MDNIQIESQLEFYKKMFLIRTVEDQIGMLVIKNIAKCPCHLAIGQEAVAVGICSNLSSKDIVYGAHRSHAHYLALGGDPYKLLAEVLGKEDGCSKGMGGSMHLYAPHVGFHGSVPIVGATIPIATGAALALKQQKKTDSVAVSFFGDGATEEGVFHESMNIASVYNLPILFACENNLYSSHLDIKLRQPSESVARYALTHNIKSIIVDGNDVLAVSQATSKLINYIKVQQKPAFIEANTYRLRGHVGPDENIDVGVRRSSEDLNKWKLKDPLLLLKNYLASNNMDMHGKLEQLEYDTISEVKSFVDRAIKAPYPHRDALLNRVFI